MSGVSSINVMNALEQLFLIACLISVIVWNYESYRRGYDSLLEREYKDVMALNKSYDYRKRSVSINSILGLNMIIVALSSGASLPYALDAVGSVFSESKGLWLRAVSYALMRGSTWREAWSPTYVLCDFDVSLFDCNMSKASKNLTDRNRNLRLRFKRNKSSFPLLAQWLSTSLRESWDNGVPALPVLKAVLKNYGDSMRNIAKQEAAKLSVRLLLPVGLCFLPAFISIGILPTVASFMQ